MSTVTTPMVGGAEIHVNGSLLDPTLGQRVSEVRVQDNLMLPTAFLIRFSDAEMANVDTHPFAVGASVEILMAAPGSSTPTSLVKGQVASVEAEFDHGGVTIAARGYDQSYVLNRSSLSQTYQNMTADDIAQKIASRNGLTPGTIDSAGAASPHEFQHNETDWAFLWRLARRIDFEVGVSDKTLNFRRAAPGASPVELRYGETLQVFRPRVTGVQQVDTVSVRAWDPSSKQAIESSADAPSQLDTSIGISRSDVASGLGGGTVAIGDRPVMEQDEADALATSVAARLANGFAEAEGTCVGDPRVHAGAGIQVEGVGTRWGGTYTITSSTHLLRGQHGYHTQFVVSGRAPRHLIDLMTPAPAREWGSSLVVGTVTQNDDPDGLGRIRVKHPDLGDSIEGWWARMATLNAGGDRGVLMLPAGRRRGGGRVRARRCSAPVRPGLGLERHRHAGRRPDEDRRVVRPPQPGSDHRQGTGDDHADHQTGSLDRDRRQDHREGERRLPGRGAVRQHQGKRIGYGRGNGRPDAQGLHRQPPGTGHRERLRSPDLTRVTRHMTTDIIGTGIAFPLRLDRRGSVALTHGGEDIREAIELILGTAPGERPMRPEFGCGIHDHIFGGIDASTLGRVEQDVRAALDRWEPRIDVVSVVFDTSGAGSGRLAIDLTYRERATNDVRNLVYPFYMIPAEE